MAAAQHTLREQQRAAARQRRPGRTGPRPRGRLGRRRKADQHQAATSIRCGGHPAQGPARTRTARGPGPGVRATLHSAARSAPPQAQPHRPVRPSRAHALIRTRWKPIPGPECICGWPAGSAAVPGGDSGIFDGSGESATCRVEEPVLGEWCLGWSIEHPGMDCLNQGPRVLP
jgi:hypothetical protein